MRKVLILSYFFPPASFAGAHRAASWSRHLPAFGWSPVVITRQWNPDQDDITGSVYANAYRKEWNGDAEIHRLPHRQTLRDRLHERHGDRRYVVARKFLSFAELVLGNFRRGAVPYSNIYEFARTIIAADPDVKAVICSGRPFQLFRFGHDLATEFGIPWVADYRDEWTSSQLRQPTSIPARLLGRLERRSEVRWLSNAAALTTCSNEWAKRISELVGRPGFTVLNGYEPDEYQAIVGRKDSESLRIVYNGTLYATQPIEEFLRAVLELRAERPDVRIRVSFLGIRTNPAQAKRVASFLGRTVPEVELTPRVPKQEAIQRQKDADVLLMVAHEGVRGNYSSKLFEYLGCGVPVLLAPSDRDVMEEFVLSTGCGEVAADSAAIKRYLLRAWALKQAGVPLPYSVDAERRAPYTRHYWAGKLAGVLDTITSSPAPAPAGRR